MQFSIPSVLALLFAAQAAAAPVEGSLEERGANVIIGFRTVAKVQADAYMKAGTLTDDKNIISTQIGPGVYMSSKRDGWPGAATNWWCVIMADQKAFDAAPKIWIPKVSGGKTLWGSTNRANTDAYIKQSGLDPLKALRVSEIDGNANKEPQLVIPSKMLNQNKGGLGITVSCKPKMTDLPANVVNMKGFKNMK